MLRIVTFFIFFIVIIILIVLLVKAVYDLFCEKDEEKTTSDKLIEGGITVILATLPSFSDSFLQFLYDWLQIAKTVEKGGFSPCWLIGLGLLLIAMGVILNIVDASSKYVILNMPGTIHHTKEDGMLKSLKTDKCDEIETNTTNCQAEMQKLSQTKTTAILGDIQAQMVRFNRETKSKRCFTGMAPIPFIVFAGTRHRGSDIKYYLEFDKATQQYSKLNNAKEYPILNKSTITTTTSEEIVVAVSTTALINAANTGQFNLPVFNLSLNEPKDNAIFSKRQLNDYVNTTVTYISDICKQNSQITKVHLLLATQACFAYALGKLLVNMQNRVPQIISYHYIAPSYKVGIVINGSSAGQIVKVQ